MEAQAHNVLALANSGGSCNHAYARSTFVPARRVLCRPIAVQADSSTSMIRSFPAMITLAAGYIGCSFALGAGMMIVVTFGLALAIATGIPGPYQR
jgi:hypothetical protein